MGGVIDNRLLLLVARLTVAGVFVVAALPKLQDPEAFAGSVRTFRVVGAAGAAWVALLLPWLELVAGTGLLLPRLRHASGLIIAALLASFVALHLSAWARGIDADCGCFGAAQGESTSYLWLILRNLALLALLLPVLWTDRADAKKSLASDAPDALHAGTDQTPGQP